MKKLYVIVPLMLLTSSGFMALAWLGHLKFKDSPLWLAILLSWCIVIPEYLLNITAIRYGHRSFSAATMATFNLCTGVVCVALVSAYYLEEPLQQQQLFGFALVTFGMLLVAAPSKGSRKSSDIQVEPAPSQSLPQHKTPV
jgi:hypothetical protein